MRRTISQKERHAVKKNDLFPLTITGMNSDGYGVGHHENMAVFVPMTAVGDQLMVRAVKVLSRYAYGKTEQLLSPSPFRQAPDCPVYRQCGGCTYRHITPQEEARIKLQQVNDALKRIGEISVPITEIISPGRQGYRNKAQYPLCKIGEHIAAGFFAPHSHRIIPHDRCLLSPECFEPILKTVSLFLEEYHIPVYDETSHTGVARHLYLRWGQATEEIMVCLVANAAHIPGEKALAQRLIQTDSRIKSVILNSNTERTNVVLGKKCRTLWGKDTIDDILCGIRVSLSPLSFYQVNHDGAQLLYEKAAEFAQLSKEDFLLDLYCGAGTIGLSMASQVARLVGVEVIPAAVENARENAEKRNKQCRILL